MNTWWQKSGIFPEQVQLMIRNKSYLLDGQGHRCCLGFECKQRGLTDDMIYGEGSPVSISLNN